MDRIIKDLFILNFEIFSSYNKNGDCAIAKKKSGKDCCVKNFIEIRQKIQQITQTDKKVFTCWCKIFKMVLDDVTEYLTFSSYETLPFKNLQIGQ